MLSPVLLERLRAWWRLGHAQGKILPGGWRLLCAGPPLQLGCTVQERPSLTRQRSPEDIARRIDHGHKQQHRAQHCCRLWHLEQAHVEH